MREGKIAWWKFDAHCRFSNSVQFFTGGRRHVLPVGVNKFTGGSSLTHFTSYLPLVDMFLQMEHSKAQAFTYRIHKKTCKKIYIITASQYPAKKKKVALYTGPK